MNSYFNFLQKTKIVIVLILVFIVKTIISDYTILQLRKKVNLLEVKMLNDSLNAKQKEVKQLISSHKQRAKLVHKKSEQIDLKKTQNEKDIDNHTITDDDIKRFISKYENLP